jgi:hypothetical protein
LALRQPAQGERLEASPDDRRPVLRQAERPPARPVAGSPRLALPEVDWSRHAVAHHGAVRHVAFPGAGRRVVRPDVDRLEPAQLMAPAARPARSCPERRVVVGSAKRPVACRRVVRRDAAPLERSGSERQVVVGSAKRPAADRRDVRRVAERPHRAVGCAFAGSLRGVRRSGRAGYARVAPQQAEAAVALDALAP